MNAKIPSFLRRLAGLIVVSFAAVLLIGVPLSEKRLERRVRVMLLTVQEGLQRYHVKEELYPKKMMTGQELVKLLVESGHLDKSLVNPWSGLPYLETAENDWLSYRTNSLAETYELVVYFPGTEEVQFRLDSTEHQSLE